MGSMLDQVRIVLLSPSGTTNVGSICRAMKNMGLSDLVIVAPRCSVPDEAAVAYAAHATDVLERARVVEDIPAALADCVHSYATTSRQGLYRRQSVVTPGEAARDSLDRARRGRVAWVFGREDYGMQTRELLHFDGIVQIPADGEYPVLNLAAAVMVCCYELRQAWIEAGEQAALPMAIDPGVARDEQKQIFFAKLFDALERIDFFDHQNPDHLKYGLRHLFGRLEMSVNEVDVLIGMASQIRWYADHHPQRTDPPTS